MSNVQCEERARRVAAPLDALVRRSWIFFVRKPLPNPNLDDWRGTPSLSASKPSRDQIHHTSTFLLGVRLASGIRLHLDGSGLLEPAMQTG